MCTCSYGSRQAGSPEKRSTWLLTVDLVLSELCSCAAIFQ